jgi:hypothetical protein
MASTDKTSTDKNCDKCKDEGIRVQHGDKLPCPQDQKGK